MVCGDNRSQSGTPKRVSTFTSFRNMVSIYQFSPHGLEFVLREF
jgi:hypothetical protein